eukprot:7719483-Karenia_brevis.AAC.1
MKKLVLKMFGAPMVRVTYLVRGLEPRDLMFFVLSLLTDREEIQVDIMLRVGLEAPPPPQKSTAKSTPRAPFAHPPRVDLGKSPGLPWGCPG